MRQALPQDIPQLVSLMTEFYAEAGYTVNRPLVTGAFESILRDERLGSIWLIQSEEKNVGYLVLTLRYGMEYSGLIACLDDLYVTPSSRNKGLATAALIAVRKFCEIKGIKALTVEVSHNNKPANTVYYRVGFTKAVDRQLLSLSLGAPSHVLDKN